MTRDFCSRCGARYDGTTPHGPGACAEERDRDLEAQVLSPIVIREAIRLLEAGQAQVALLTLQSFLADLEGDPK